MAKVTDKTEAKRAPRKCAWFKCTNIIERLRSDAKFCRESEGACKQAMWRWTNDPMNKPSQLIEAPKFEEADGVWKAVFKDRNFALFPVDTHKRFQLDCMGDEGEVVATKEPSFPLHSIRSALSWAKFSVGAGWPKDDAV